jgi:hypothetical protein
MVSFRRIALLLALCLPALCAVQAQSSSSSSNPATPTQDQAQPAAAAAQAQPQMSVQARIKLRREQRRAAAIHEIYDHRYEAYAGMGYLRFKPGPTLERAHEYAWDTGFTRYYGERLGVTVDGRGYYGTAYVFNNQETNSFITNPAIIEYAVLAGPTYRFYLQPKYSISGRVLGGFANGNFSGDTSNNTALSTALGLYPNGSTFAASANLLGEYNLTPNIGLRVAPEYFVTGFGSTQQNSLGFTLGVVYRFGKQ